MKFTTPRLNIHQNAAELMQQSPLVYPMLYASSFNTLNKSGYTNVAKVESRTSSLVLSRCGNVTEQVTQTLNYLPYGEDWVDIQNFAETQYPRLGIYSFNGKEKDYESGYHYYGARYYWSELLTGWLSVNPMMDKYPSMSPYNYCAWNPVNVIDPDGREMWKPEITSKGEVSYVAEKGDSKESFVRQYNVSQEAADKIFENAGVDKVSEGTRISGKVVATSVTNRTGRKYDDVLKLNWGSSSKKQKVYHTMFSLLVCKIRGDGGADMRQFINGLDPEGGDQSLKTSDLWGDNTTYTIPLVDGKEMPIIRINTFFSKIQPFVCSPQPFIDIDDHLSSRTTQTWNGPKGNFPLLTITFKSEYKDIYVQNYY